MREASSSRLERWRLLALLPFAGVSVAVIVRLGEFRALEARMCEPLIGLLTTGPHSTVAVRDVVYFGLGSSTAIGLRITNECTTAMLIIPFLVVMGGAALRTSVAVTRVVVATLIGVAMLSIVNIVRVGGIGWATYHWGSTTGYEISHLFVGSLFALAGFALSLMVAIRFLVKGRDARLPRRTPGRHART